MRFGFDEEPLLFQRAVRDFLGKECTPEAVRALWRTESARSPALWRGLAELGVVGALAPEACGGLGRDEVDLVLVLEEAGRAALAEPLVATAAVGVPLLRELGGALADAWLPRVAAGEARLAVGHPVSPFVADAHVADLLLLARGEDELHAVPAGDARLAAEPANDPSQRLFSAEWTPAPATLAARGAPARALLDAALDRGALAAAAELVGAAERCLELAVAHAGQREQFGRPIGSFQAVKHLLADAKVRLEYARPAVWRAAWSVARGHPRRALHVSLAKVQAGLAARRATRAALQVHGAIGYTWECDLHLYMRRAWSLELAWGSGAFHLARIAGPVLAGDVAIGPGTTFAEE
jgi:alkylation response protein AidB-like acyl-CoA dehydrogenase